jgi:hypothetical protein
MAPRVPWRSAKAERMQAISTNPARRFRGFQGTEMHDQALDSTGDIRPNRSSKYQWRTKGQFTPRRIGAHWGFHGHLFSEGHATAAMTRLFKLREPESSLERVTQVELRRSAFDTPKLVMEFQKQESPSEWAEKNSWREF